MCKIVEIIVRSHLVGLQLYYIKPILHVNVKNYDRKQALKNGRTSYSKQHFSVATLDIRHFSAHKMN